MRPAGSIARTTAIVGLSLIAPAALAQAVSALPDSGTADAGIASRPIANVAGNDTINGSPVVLGSSGTVAQVGTWPSGITLAASTGAISTAVSVPAASYPVTYQLCDRNLPPNCASATDTITVINASIVAAPESGTADAGIGSRPIANVATNDAIDGVAATLGSSGNSTVAQVGTWPPGIAFTPSTGTVLTTTGVAAGTYSIAYKLCDRNVPPQCASTTDTVTVINSSIIANPDSGTADAGVGSRPIANVAANDMVNGAPPTLGASGNATLAQAGTWPAGIALTASTGTVLTTAGLAAGSYSIAYRLCDRNSPANCANATDSVTVINASVVPNPESGTADAGIASRPIANVAANDMINRSPATLGTSGNATLAQVGTWPSGIALTPSTGNVSTTRAVSAGTYSIQYRLCDRNVPPVCVAATDSVTVVNAAIIANVESGTAAVGVASTPIANVAANDTINGAPATLGTSGNATVVQIGVWPSGTSFSSTTGAVTTSPSVPAGSYSLQYRLCDRNQPPVCVTATDTLNVISVSVTANPDSGTANAGVASTPILNVTANDSVNGAAATLGTSGNATISQTGSWPGGITLNPSSGAINTDATVPGGTYSVSYQLCDTNAPPDCASTTDTIRVINASVMANPESGTGTVGLISTPIATVVTNDTVNGAPATLGTSGNATITQSGNWPSGISLDTTTGAITVTADVPTGVYTLLYQLCDANVSTNCSLATDTITESFAEVQVSSVSFGDVEFDWGRDGVYCATCNFGQGNARFNWTDKNGNLWVGHVDPQTGTFTPPTGDNELADTTAFFYTAFGNGPEWAFSTQNGEVISQLVYTRFPPSTPPSTSNAGAALATPGVNGWSVAFLPGASPSSGGAINTIDPVAGQCNADSVSLALFSDLGSPKNVYWEPLSTAAGVSPTVTPFGSYATSISGGKPSVRWIPCTRNVVFIGAAPPDGSGKIYQQVFWYNIDTQVVQQLTTDSNNHTEAYIFQAPEFADTYVLATISNNLEIDVYEQNGTGTNGAPLFQLIKQVISPDSAEPYILGMEPLIHCTPGCQSYLIMKLESIVSNASNITTVANGLAVTNIDPARPLFKLLEQQTATPTIQRADAEYFITAKGAFLYYDRNTISSPTTQFQQHGSYYIDMQLGPPSGPCVGSSAEGGMLPGC